MKWNKRLFCLFLVVLCLWAAAFPALAASPCSLTVAYEDTQYPLVGASFQIYLVAQYGDEGTLVVTKDFAAYHVNISDDPSTWPQLAPTLAAYAAYGQMEPAAYGITDSQGRLTFSGLSEGIYLVTGDPHRQNDRFYTADPALVKLPGTNITTGEEVRDVVIAPKGEWAPDAEGDGKVELKVLKIWNDNNSKSRPASVTVHLLQDGAVYDTVTLSRDNLWRHLWTDLPEEHSWNVVEDPVPGYTVTITRQGITFVVTNTSKDTPPPPWKPEDPVDPEPPENPEHPKPPIKPGETLPETGQPWAWVLLLAAAGLGLLVLGLYIRRGKQHEA